jgi:5-methylcytosine-specific restriction enzyme subunit McrC
MIIELTEYQPKILPRHYLSESNGRFLFDNFQDQIEVEAPNLLNDNNWKLTSLGYVGFIPLAKDEGLSLKSKVGLANLFGMLEYAYKLDFKILEGIFECSSLNEFYERLAHFLAKKVILRQKKGLYRTYITQSETLGVIRGRIDVKDAIHRPWNVNRRCDFEEHTADIDENCILLWTLHCILKGGICSERVIPTIRKSYRGLYGSLSLQQYTFKHCIGRLYNRLNRDYLIKHGLCRFFLEHSGPLHGTGENTLFPFLIDMAHLYELFVAEWLKENLPVGYTLDVQHNVTFSEANKLRFVIDLVVYDEKSGEPIIVLDTKYKTTPIPSTADISQVVAYSEVKGCKYAALIYPQNPLNQFDEVLGEIRVRSIGFKVDGNLEQNGREFIRNLGLPSL